MQKIKLLYAKNVVSRRAGGCRQELLFMALVENLAYEKAVEVAWAGEDGLWHTLAAEYHSTVEGGRERWLARTAIDLTGDASLPGNVEFALRCRALGAEAWDNNHGKNYSVQADTGVLPAGESPVLNVGFETVLAEGERLLPITVAVDQSMQARKVTVQWTSDDWQTSGKSVCRFRRDYWDSECASNARNPNHYGCQIWQGHLKVGDAYRVQYRISCEGRQQLLRDDNFGRNYCAQRRPLRVLILNLHCCQEENQDYKLSQIAKAIDELHVDVVCLQEVAERWNDGKGDWQTNTARIINERLAAPFHLVTDWSHRGFDRFREGVAVLSRYPIERHQARYVSSSRDPLNIHARKVVMAQVRVPYFGLLNVFSSHLSWWDDGFGEQFENLRNWAASEHSDRVRATMLGGDFNIAAGSRGYQFVVDTREYDDQYLAVNSPDVFRRVFRVDGSRAEEHVHGDERIDYIFLRRESRIAVTSGRTVFTEQDYGRVSDHVGYTMTFEPI